MKLLVATPLSPPDSGGPAVYSDMIQRELPKQGIEVRLVSFRDVRQLPKGLSHLVFFWRLLRHAWGMDMVYALDPVSVGLPARWVARLYSKPFIARTPGFYAWEQGRQRAGLTETLDQFVEGITQKRRYPWRVRKWLALQLTLARQADLIIVPSQYLKDLYEKLGVPTGHLKVVYSAFTERFPEAVVEQKREPGLIVSVARLVPWKGMGGLLNAFATVTRDVSSVRLVIIGDGPERARLENQVEEIGLQDSVVFTGALTHDQVLDWLSRAEVFALNTSYEGFSHVLLEAMDAGATVVTTPVGGNVEMIESGKQGLLVPCDNHQELHHALTRILLDPTYGRRLARTAKQSVTRFSKEQAIKRLVSVLQKV